MIPPEEGVIQRKKRDVLKDVIKKGKAHLLGGKAWSIDQIDEANDKIIEKLYQNYTQLEMHEKVENTGKTMENILLSYIPTELINFKN